MKLIFNPFERFSTQQLLGFGLAANVVGAALGYWFNLRFDGALDLHFSNEAPLNVFVLELSISLACILLALFLAARTYNPKTRIVDILTAVFIARIPMYLLFPTNWGNRLSDLAQHVEEMAAANRMDLSPTDLVTLLLMTVPTLLCTVWFFALLWNGYKVACNAKGPKPIWLFVAAVLLAEIISKILILIFLQ